MILNIKKLHSTILNSQKIYTRVKFLQSNTTRNNQQQGQKQKKQRNDKNQQIKTSQVNLKEQENIGKNMFQNYQQNSMVKSQSEELIQKKFQQIEITSFNNRSFTNLTQLQKQIIKQNKFDLTNPQIQPKMTTINSFKGIQANLTQINLGKVKVKNQNQVFLSQIDPYNIPQDYQIRFDKQKILTIVGKQVNQNIQPTETNNKIMNISAQQSFQEKNITQLAQKYLGVGYKYQYNRKQSFRGWLLAGIFFYIIGYPILDTFKQYYYCVQSIKKIQSEHMNELQKIKRQSMMKALLNNQDFSKIL